jgi:hypothetical protein
LAGVVAAATDSDVGRKGLAPLASFSGFGGVSIESGGLGVPTAALGMTASVVCEYRFDFRTLVASVWASFEAVVAGGGLAGAGGVLDDAGGGDAGTCATGAGVGEGAGAVAV